MKSIQKVSVFCVPKRSCFIFNSHLFFEYPNIQKMSNNSKCLKSLNKMTTSQVGAISKAQKAQNIFWKNLKFLIFLFQKMSHSAEKCNTEAKRCFATHDEDIDYFNMRIYIILIACVYIQQFNFVQ